MPFTTAPFTPLTERPGPSLPDFPLEDLRRYSLARGVRISGGGESGRGTREQEMHDALDPVVSRILGQSFSPRGLLVPGNVQGALDASTTGEGEELVFVRPGSFIDGIRARSVLGSLGATIQGAQLPTSEPRLDDDVTVEWIAEDPGSGMSDTEPTLGSVAYELHTLACNVPYSRQLLTQTFGMRSVDGMVARAAEAAIGAEWDRVGVQGSGASNEPTGILNTAGIGAVAIGANGGAPTYDHVVDLEHEVAVDDADAGRLGFATTSGMRRKLRKTEEFSGAGPIWRGSRLLGHPTAVSSNVPSDLTKGTGTNLHALIFGNWADLVVTMIPVLDVVVDPFTLKKQGVIEATFFQYLDVKVRRPVSFAAIQDADPS